MAQLLGEVAPEKVTLEEIDISQDPDRREIDEIDDVPTISIASDSTPARVRFQGLPTGTEFPALIDAVERVSRGEHGLSESSLVLLQQLTEPTEVMVFATPT
jgi:alkyl hydroperoxide reductase subunit AhpF